MGRFSQAHTLDVWYYHVEADSVVKVFDQTSKQAKKRAAKLVKKARTKTHQQTIKKLTHFEGGKRRINSDPPLLVPFRKEDVSLLLSAAEQDRMSEAARKTFGFHFRRMLAHEAGTQKHSRLTSDSNEDECG